MAEKEERILILTGNKDIYPAWNYSHGPLYLDKDYYDGISYTEAINLIEKVMEEGFWSSGKSFRQISEDVLNALLEK